MNLLTVYGFLKKYLVAAQEPKHTQETQDFQVTMSMKGPRKISGIFTACVAKETKIL